MTPIMANAEAQSISNPTEIVCPTWCTVSAAQHIEELSNWEGSCLHQGTFWEGGGHKLLLATTTWPDGSPDEAEDAAPEITITSTTASALSPLQARGLGRALLTVAGRAAATA